METSFDVEIRVVTIASRIGQYIESNFDATDFLTLGNVSRGELTALLTSLRVRTVEDGAVIRLNRTEMQGVSDLFWYGGNYLDENPEFADCYQEIDNLAKVTHDKLMGGGSNPNNRP